MKEYHFKFSEENVTELSKLIEELNNILAIAGFGIYADKLTKIGLAAENKDKTNFNKNILSNTLFGGSGALWEIYIENEKMRKVFVNKFCSLIDHFKKMGIQNNRIDQVRETMPILSR